MSRLTTSLQDSAAPDGVCYGCGSHNPHGLHIKSYWHEDGVHVIAEHLPDPKYCGWPELVYGGMIAMLVDCHSNWTAMAYHYRMEQRDAASLPAGEPPPDGGADPDEKRSILDLFRQ